MAPSPENETVILSVQIGVGGESFQTSGVLVSPDEILTVSHAVQNTDSETGVTSGPVVSSITIDGFGGLAENVHYNTPLTSNYTVTSATTDVALIHLATPLWGIGYAALESGYAGAVSIFGFPGGQALPIVEPQTVSEVLPGEFAAYNVIPGGFDGGTSGAPLYAGYPASNAVVGLYAAGFTNGEPGGIGVEFTPTLVGEIELWQAQDGESPVIERLYQGILGRAPEAAGLLDWSSKIVTAANGQWLPATQLLNSHPEIVDGFFHSVEFQSAHPGIAGGALVTLLYEQALGRAPDPAGYSAWMEDLTAHVLTEEQVIVGITQSPEAILHQPIYGT